VKQKSKLYTKTGDKGETSLMGGDRVKKIHPRIVACGNIDELNASLAVAASFSKDRKINNLVSQIQNELFNIGAELSSPKKLRRNSSESAETFYSLSEIKITELEDLIDQFDKDLPALRNFILPGGTQSASLLHLSRTICRRAERYLIRLSETEEINPNILKYLNRLSDLLFVLARTANEGQDILWKK
jgi:cob(I)alamin adenosyltransferase